MLDEDRSLFKKEMDTQQGQFERQLEELAYRVSNFHQVGISANHLGEYPPDGNTRGEWTLGECSARDARACRRSTSS